MSVAPSEFPPPVDSAEEFVGPPTDSEDERIEVGVAIVGGGQAGMACAIRLMQLLADDEEMTERLGEVPVAVIEKGRVAGAHQLSGGVMNPKAIRALLPDDDSWPHYGEVERETVYFMLNRKRAVPLKPTPPPFRNHGNYVVSVAELNRWLGERAEEAGAYILSETVGALHRLAPPADQTARWAQVLGLADRMVANARRQITAFDIRPGDPALPARALSGGNQQKIVVAREMGRDFRVLLAAQPTRGVDVGAIEFIHGQLRAARAAGKAILLVSADLAEVLALSDRIAVMYGGRFVIVLSRERATEEILGTFMTGAEHAA